MKLLQVINRVSHALKKESCQFCLIGGHATSLYRSQERFTKDVDFALLGVPRKLSREIAERAIKSIGLAPVVGFIPKAQNEKPRRGICMITSAPKRDERHGIVDILLPKLPWIPAAVERAQHNLIELGFAKIPVITPEDLVVAKVYALNNSPDRFQDLDDLKEIFEHVPDLDYDYLEGALLRLELVIPQQVLKYYRFAK